MIKIITDSTLCVRRAEAAELGLRIIPISYEMGEVRRSEFFTDANLCGGFEKHIESGGRINTLRPSPAVIAGIFREELSGNNELLCITLSSRLSGIFSSATLAAGEFRGGRIHVFDSRLTAGGLYLLVREAARLVSGGRGIGEILVTLEKIRDRITSYFSVGDMSLLRESGRIGFMRMSVGTILNMRPILLCREGVVEYDLTARGEHEIIKKLSEKIPPDSSGAVINYIGCNQTASDLYNVIKSKHPALMIRLSRLGPVLSAHLGPRAVALSFIRA